MAYTWEDAASTAGLGLIQGLTNEMFAERNMSRQRSMAAYNQGLALDMWNKTNYEAQRRHMERAGLNVGLMYKGAGEGGRTAGAGTGQASEAQAPTLGLDMQMQKAQIQLAEAQAEKAMAEANSIRGGEGTVGAQQNIQSEAETRRIEKETEVKELERKFQENLVYLQNMTIDEALEKIRADSEKAIADAKTSSLKAKEDEATLQTRIDQIKMAATEQIVRIATMRNGIKLNDANINKIALEMQSIAADRIQSWDKLNYQEREVIAKEMMAKAAQEQTEFNTSTAATIKQWVNILTDIAHASGSVMKGLK